MFGYVDKGIIQWVGSHYSTQFLRAYTLYVVYLAPLILRFSSLPN